MADLLSPSLVRYQLSKSPDLSGVGEEGRRLSRPGGERGGEEAGEGSLEDAGGEGGSAGRSLWRGLIWRMVGRAVLLESYGLVNACYYAFEQGDKDKGNRVWCTQRVYSPPFLTRPLPLT